MVKAEDSWTRGLGFNPPLRRPFLGTIHLDQSLEQKIVENSNLALLHVLYGNPANRRVDFEEWLAYKIQLHDT